MVSATSLPLSLNCRGRLIPLRPVLIMGILNVTPDSFSDGGKFLEVHSALSHAEKLIKEGADILDIGGASSRPGSTLIDAQVEWERVGQIIQAVRKTFPDTLISLDTWRASVAKHGLDEGVDLINDISAGMFEPEIFTHVARANAPYIAMHMKGTPQNMQDNPHYQNLEQEVLGFLAERTSMARQAGIKEVILDPGFGFGKTLEQNYRLFKALPAFVQTGQAVAIGISKKSMLTQLIGASKEEVSDLASILHYQAIQAGVHLIRAHAPKPVAEARKLYTYLNSLPHV
jgi:dihydropteroate synthase